MTDADAIGLRGTGVPVVTPFDDDGAVATDDLRTVASHVEAHVDFLVPCGSSGEAPLLTADERSRVVETVADATDLPVLAGTGTAGYERTLRATDRAAEAGADAALVVTPYYYPGSPAETVAYYRDLADAAPLPVYLYDVPTFTGHRMAVDTVTELAGHPSIAGIKDSTGDVERLGRIARAVGGDSDFEVGGDGEAEAGGDDQGEGFDVLVGAGGVYAHGLDAGADGGVLALANVVPELAARIYERHPEDPAAARDLNADLVALNRAITADHGVPGIKAALASRGVPAGRPRRPLRPVDDEVRERLATLVETALDRA